MNEPRTATQEQLPTISQYRPTTALDTVLDTPWFLIPGALAAIGINRSVSEKGLDSHYSQLDKLGMTSKLTGNPAGILHLVRWPGRLSAEQAAQVLGYPVEAIRVLVTLGLLKPLGNPAPNAAKYFARAHVEECADDPIWQKRATQAIYEYHRKANARRLPKSTTGAANEGKLPSIEL